MKNYDDTVIKELRKVKMPDKKFVRYKEGAKLYSMSISKFKEIAMDAGAIYKVGKVVLVNCKRLDNYLEGFRIDPDIYY